MENQEIENFRKRMVLVICWAGSDRSRLIAEELNNRGYIASSRGMLNNHNYATKEDVADAASVIFASPAEKRELSTRNKVLEKALNSSQPNIYVMNITESEKERALQSKETAKLIEKIKTQLDDLGFLKINNLK